MRLQDNTPLTGSLFVVQVVHVIVTNLFILPPSVQWTLDSYHLKTTLFSWCHSAVIQTHSSGLQRFGTYTICPNSSSLDS